MPSSQDEYHMHAALCADCSGVDMRTPFSRRCPYGKVLVKRAVQADIVEGLCQSDGQSFQYPKKQPKRTP